MIQICGGLRPTSRIFCDCERRHARPTRKSPGRSGARRATDWITESEPRAQRHAIRLGASGRSVPFETVHRVGASEDSTPRQMRRFAPAVRSALPQKQKSPSRSGWGSKYACEMSIRTGALLRTSRCGASDTSSRQPAYRMCPPSDSSRPSPSRWQRSRHPPDAGIRPACR